MTMSKDMQARTIAAIGTAQAKLGDLAAARSTWQIALDSAGENTSFNAPLSAVHSTSRLRRPSARPASKTKRASR